MHDVINCLLNLAQFLIPAAIFTWADRPRRASVSNARPVRENA